MTPTYQETEAAFKADLKALLEKYSRKNHPTDQDMEAYLYVDDDASINVYIPSIIDEDDNIIQYGGDFYLGQYKVDGD